MAQPEVWWSNCITESTEDTQNGLKMSLQVLSRSVGHAIKILIYLAISAGHPVPASHVAECAQIPCSQAAKILHYLTLRGLVRSRRGSSGGYLLREGAEQATVEQVMQLFTPPVPDEEDYQPSGPLREMWLETTRLYQQAWGQLTIAELAKRTVNGSECPLEASGGESEPASAASAVSKRESR
ncbi:MAG: Rrf2 family transcriptional regulator [Acidobacteriia bacterium]|nr:Rrf2 family transcriptional regulator [Terriglobia bacterium]